MASSDSTDRMATDWLNIPSSAMGFLVWGGLGVNLGGEGIPHACDTSSLTLGTETPNPDLTALVEPASFGNRPVAQAHHFPFAAKCTPL